MAHDIQDYVAETQTRFLQHQRRTLHQRHNLSNEFISHLTYKQTFPWDRPDPENCQLNGCVPNREMMTPGGSKFGKNISGHGYSLTKVELDDTCSVSSKASQTTATSRRTVVRNMEGDLERHLKDGWLEVCCAPSLARVQNVNTICHTYNLLRYTP
eukprot:4880518-Pyramimonas_sp.AAC.1